MRRPALEATKVRDWTLLVTAVLLVSTLLDVVGLPSPALFGALLVGLVYAVSVSEPVTAPSSAVTVGQAIIGTTIGAYFDLDTLTALRDDWLPVLAACVGTLVLSVAAGFVLRTHRGVSAATGAFAMVAGGASGIVSIARELGADDRVVAVVQYLRVLLIIVGMPVVSQLVFHPDKAAAGAGVAGASLGVGGVGGVGGAGGVGAVGGHATWPVEVLVTAICLVVGLVLARVVRIPAASLLMPLLIAVLISLTGVVGTVSVPVAIQDVGYALIGLQVGLRFTRASLRSVASLLPLALATIVGLIVACALLGVVLADVTGHSKLDGYLATTPGGLYAVVAAAIGSGSDVTFVLTVQIVRLFVMLFSAPLLARWLRSRGRGRSEAQPRRQNMK